MGPLDRQSVELSLGRHHADYNHAATQIQSVYRGSKARAGYVTPVGNPRVPPVPASTVVSPEQAALRSGMAILVHLSGHAENRDLVLDSDLTDYLFGDAVVFSADKKLRRQAARVAAHLAECGGDASPRHLALMAKGCVGAVQVRN